MVRLHLTDGRTFVGGYVGWTDQSLYIADPLSGEIIQFHGNEVDDFDVRKTNG